MSLALGIDIGTSGVRAVALGADGVVQAEAAAAMAEAGGNPRDPAVWWRATEAALGRLFAKIDPSGIGALAVDGTSGTLLPVDGNGRPLADALMYNDPVRDAAVLAAVAAHAPPASAAHGPTSGLAKALHFAAAFRPARVIHQADWLAGQFSGRFDLTDENNALKTGYDPVSRRWPEWIADTGIPLALLPSVAEPGAPLGQVSAEAAARWRLSIGTLVVAGTTDGCASFLATGASLPGEGVTALGSSLTLKLLCDAPIFAPEYGIYSHRLGETWLAGGASNTGGKVLAQFFSKDALRSLSTDIDPAVPSGLDFYPLTAAGERFPVSDPMLPPRLEPRPASDALFLQGMLEGIAAIEALGYRRLAELGAPLLRSVRSVGGGAANPTWTAIRQSRLGVPMLPAASDEAAAGAARLALQGAQRTGRL